MLQTLRCPNCDVELALPPIADDQIVQCTRCQRSFKPTARANSAITAVVPLPGDRGSPTEDHELFAEPRNLVPLHPPAGAWFTVVTRLTLAACAAAFALPVAFSIYDWLVPGFRPPDDGRIANREERMLIDHAFIWIQVTAWPALLAFGIWLLIASQNARRLANGLKFNSGQPVFVPFLILFNGVALTIGPPELLRGEYPSLLVGCLIVHLLGGIVAFVNLQEIWRAGDPNEVTTPLSWRKVPGSRRIRLWAAVCLAAPLMVLAAFFADDLGKSQWVWPLLLIAPLSFAVANMILIGVIRSITTRQRERYARLLEDAA